MSWNTGQNSGYGFPSPHHGGGGYGPPPGPPQQPGWGGSPYGFPPPTGGHGFPSGPGYPGAQWHQQPQHGGYYPSPPAQAQQAAHFAAPRMPPSGNQTYGPTYENGRQQNWFQYSQCNGRKKALCVGINYFGQQAELKGCINDATNVQQFLCRKYGYKPDDIVMLTDDAANPAQQPTRANMLRAMQWLVGDAHPNDSLFFHFSGHGGQTKDLDGDEEDGHDEVIYPVDFESAGHIVDDELHFVMVKPLPPGCRLTAIFDCCHSGSALDLPFMYSTEGKIKEPNLLAEAGQGLLNTGLTYLKGDKKGALKGLFNVVKTAAGKNNAAAEHAKQTKTSPADAISWSGCKDSQTSADTVEAGQSTGAMSYAFIKSLTENPHQTYQQLLVSIREELRNKYSQKPQLACSHPMDTSILFIC